jgi:hypothetical protein
LSDSTGFGFPSFSPEKPLPYPVSTKAEPPLLQIFKSL